MNKSFDEWVAEKEKEIFRKEEFKAIGKEDDFIFQSLVFTGEAFHRLAVATTVLDVVEEAPNEIKEELKSLQQQLFDWQEKLRNIQA